MELRPYQLAAVDRVRELYRQRKRVLLVAPTGAGKTVKAALLRRKGRCDEIGFELARATIGAIAANGWRVPDELRRHPRMRRPRPAAVRLAS